MKEVFSFRHQVSGSGKRGPDHLAGGFSLIEMLMVVGIMAILLVISVPAFSSLMSSNNLAQGGQILADQINLARQMASAKNQAIEFRLIRLGGVSAKGYHAVQLWGSDTTGVSRPLSRLILFPQNILVSENKTALSTALEYSSEGTMPAGAGAAGDAPYAAFQIRPSGVVTPPMPMDDFYFTVVSARHAEAATLPDNYVTVQINPQTGTALIYRP